MSALQYTAQHHLLSAPSSHRRCGVLLQMISVTSLAHIGCNESMSEEQAHIVGCTRLAAHNKKAGWLSRTDYQDASILVLE